MSNRDATKASSRKGISNTELSLADSEALRKAVKKLGSFEYSETDSKNAKNGVRAYVETYNNILSSASGSSDYEIKRYAKKLKSLTGQYEDELEKAGISIKKDSTLEVRDTYYDEMDASKLEKLFSRDANYMQKVSTYARRIQNRSEELDMTERQARAAAQKSAPDGSGATFSALAQGMEAGIAPDDTSGTHFNVSV